MGVLMLIPGVGQAPITAVARASTDQPSKKSPLHLTVVPRVLDLRSGANSSVIALVLENHLARPLRADGVRVEAPDGLEVNVKDHGLVIRPGSQAVFAVDIRAGDGTAPQDSSVIFRVTIGNAHGKSWLEAGVAEPVHIEPPAQQALLVALGIPGLVLVPGFLLIVTASALWRLRLARQWWDQDEFPIAVPGAEFWAGSVTLSIVAAFLAQLVGVDLLNSYSLSVLLWVWLGSLFAGVIGYLVLIGARNYRHAARTPATTDDPLTALRRLHRQGLTARCERYRVGAESNAPILYLLHRPDETRETSWLSPGIKFEWIGEEREPLKGKLNRLLDEAPDARKLARLLKRGKRKGELEVNWDPPSTGDLPGPRLLDTKALNDEEGPRVIVHRG